MTVATPSNIEALPPRRSPGSLRLLAMLLLAVGLGVGCGDDGRSDDGPPAMGDDDDDDDGRDDGGAGDDDDAGVDDDGGVADDGGIDAGTADDGGVDGGAGDAGPDDDAGVDGGTADDAGVDGGTTDAGTDAGSGGTDAGSGGGGCGSGCGTDEWCDYPGLACGTDGRSGTCEARPGFCTGIFDPVCGCDGMTYSNECNAQAAGTDIQSRGSCP